MQLSLIPAEYRHDSVFRVTDYGVSSDGSAPVTAALQAVLELCREKGGIVVFPKGIYRVGGLLGYSETTFYLEEGARIYGSERCEDYPIFPIPAGVEMRSDMELIRHYYGTPWDAYRRAILSVYGGSHIAVIGEADTLIDGCDCTDPQGEEGYRGPHGLFFTNIQGVYLWGYTIANCGNFMHEIENSTDIVMDHVTALGGSDGTHMHCSRRILIKDCVFHTGDDCIAGIDMVDLHVLRCDLNTSCDIFRAGGAHFLIEDCHMWGPGIYPHRMTVVQNRGTEAVRDKANTLPREQGRHNLIGVFLHFATPFYPAPEPYHDIVFRNCTVENADFFLRSVGGEGNILEKGEPMKDITLDRVTFTGLGRHSDIAASPTAPMTVYLRDVKVSFREGSEGESLLGETDAYTSVVELA